MYILHIDFGIKTQTIRPSTEAEWECLPVQSHTVHWRLTPRYHTRRKHEVLTQGLDMKMAPNPFPK